MKRRAILIGLLILICMWRMWEHDREKPVIMPTGNFVFSAAPQPKMQITIDKPVEFCHVVDDNSRLLAVPCDDSVAPEDEAH